MQQQRCTFPDFDDARPKDRFRRFERRRKNNDDAFFFGEEASRWASMYSWSAWWSIASLSSRSSVSYASMPRFS